jgi:hypothetical protein
METKILNKKVGCALIAASLLAASSVQGSNMHDIYVNAVYLGNSSGGKVAIYYPGGYERIFRDVSRGEKVDLQNVIFKGGSNLSWEYLEEHGFSGFQEHVFAVNRSVQVTILVPDDSDNPMQVLAEEISNEEQRIFVWPRR